MWRLKAVGIRVAPSVFQEFPTRPSPRKTRLSGSPRFYPVARFSPDNPPGGGAEFSEEFFKKSGNNPAFRPFKDRTM
jgi:hypothetical protein